MPRRKGSALTVTNLQIIIFVKALPTTDFQIVYLTCPTFVMYEHVMQNPNTTAPNSKSSGLFLDD